MVSYFNWNFMEDEGWDCLEIFLETSKKITDW